MDRSHQYGHFSTGWFGFRHSSLLPCGYAWEHEGVERSYNRAGKQSACLWLLWTCIENNLTSKVISNTVENVNTRLWKKILPKMKTKQLLSKDIKLLEWLEKGGRPGGYEDFLKLLKLASTPLPKQVSSKASNQRSGEAKDRTWVPLFSLLSAFCYNRQELWTNNYEKE